jgi:uncharacterized protein YyaL (SSP411 family)
LPLDPHAAASPVQWMEWGPAAFDKARREDKPILLRISAVWCHWCHVMDDTTDADPEVARRINEWFVPVRVDNDERPDINDRYNLGGWPTTAFLTSAGDLITGGTYFPPEPFKDVLERIHRGWREQRDSLDAEVQRIRRRRQERALQRGPMSVDGAAIARVGETVLDAFDWRFGGFGTEPKFPQPEALRLLLNTYAATGSEPARQAAETTLILMRTAGEDEGRNYGLYDHVSGGFFRYSTTRDWSEPHFEKMCEDNARLALAYLDGYRLLGDELYRGTVSGIFDYVLRILSDPDGGAYGSQDADGEAAFYGKDLAERAELPHPFIDRRFYTNWSGMMAVAALESAPVLEWAELGIWARRTVERLTKALTTPEGAMRHVYRPLAAGAEVDRHSPILLGDQAWWLQATLRAYQATGDPRWRDRAAILAATIERDFFDPRRGACRDRAASDAEGHLSDAHYPMADNCAAAEALADWAALGGGERWRERAEGILAALQPEAERLGFMGATWALAAARVLSEPVQIHVVGPPREGPARALRAAAWRPYVTARVVEPLDPATSGGRLKALGYPTDVAPRAYVCVGDRCLEPVSNPDDLTAVLSEMELGARSGSTAILGARTPE